MDPEVKAAWTAALRSGDYKQCREQLHEADSDQYCCLGVLCDLAVKAGVLAPFQAVRNPYNRAVYYGYPDGDSEMGVNLTSLPGIVQNWAGLSDVESSNDPMVFVPDEVQVQYSSAQFSQLSSLNDNSVPFETIADLIDASL